MRRSQPRPDHFVERTLVLPDAPGAADFLIYQLESFML
jgi:hypothetical protein